ncbi:MAG: nucleotidyl transferase [Phycisphaeraceae bacterium]|nr:nucleotidyl transferase [Phycisphaeraceae bacterium]
MQPIIIGAGRGQRLGPHTEEQPKCYVRVGDRSILSWTLDAFAGADLKTPVFIGGYQIDRIRGDHPQLTYCHNRDWPNNNILASLMHAEAHMNDGFVCAYSDILFRDTVVRDAIEHRGDIVLCVDTRWRDRYVHRSEHPEDDAEKVLVDGDRVVRISREIAPADADGEYIGVACFTPDGAHRFIEHYHRVASSYAGRPWRNANTFEKAYLILLFQEMIEHGIDIRMAPTHGDYMEIDTEEDLRLANEMWIQDFDR